PGRVGLQFGQGPFLAHLGPARAAAAAGPDPGVHRQLGGTGVTRRVPLAMRLGALVAALLLPAVAPLLPSVVPRWPAAPFGVAAAQASEEPAPLYLSQALADAQRCGPGFASARMDGEAVRLEQLARAAELAPRLRIGAATDLRPGVQTRPVLQLEW